VNKFCEAHDPLACKGSASHFQARLAGLNAQLLCCGLADHDSLNNMICLGEWRDAAQVSAGCDMREVLVPIIWNQFGVHEAVFELHGQAVFHVDNDRAIDAGVWFKAKTFCLKARRWQGFQAQNLIGIDVASLLNFQVDAAYFEYGTHGPRVGDERADALSTNQKASVRQVDKRAPRGHATDAELQRQLILGRHLIARLEFALFNRVKQVFLDSGIDRFGHRFYYAVAEYGSRESTECDASDLSCIYKYIQLHSWALLNRGITMPVACDWLITDIRIASFNDNGAPYGQILDGVIAIRGDTLLYVGGAAGAPAFAAQQVVNGGQRWATPGLVDCHTHLIFGGNRAAEFEQRLQGIDYQQIARQGGGINSTVNATRAASETELLSGAMARARRLLAEGVTTFEVKSGYGLDVANEVKMLRVGEQLAHQLPATVCRTFLGAHALPVEFKDSADAYIDHVCAEMIPLIAEQGLATAVDVFCEGIGFTPAQCQRVFVQAKAYGLSIKAHVEQLSDLKGAVLAAKHGALSVDHLEYLVPEDVPVLKEHGAIAVLLPAAYYFLHETRKPPIDALRARGVKMAVATDLNPGTAPMASILLAMNQACVLFGLTPEESLRGATHHGALALGLKKKGVLAAGMDADLLLWDINHPAELAYAINFHRPHYIWQAGIQRLALGAIIEPAALSQKESL
jgi:imidazolonepropionase